MSIVDIEEVEHTIKTGGVISSEKVMDMVREIKRVKAENVTLVNAVAESREILRTAIEGRR